jgi:hypothetical protein
MASYQLPQVRISAAPALIAGTITMHPQVTR